MWIEGLGARFKRTPAEALAARSSWQVRAGQLCGKGSQTVES